MRNGYPATQLSMLDTIEMTDNSYAYFVSYFYEGDRGINAGFANKIINLDEKITKHNIIDMLGTITAKLCYDAEQFGLAPETIHVVIINYRLIE